MNALLFDVCWVVGGLLAGLVLYQGFHQGWFSVRVRIDQEWAREQQRHDRLAAAADPHHYRPLSDKAAKGFKKANQRVIP